MTLNTNERALLKKLMSHPLELPDDFRSWLKEVIRQETPASASGLSRVVRVVTPTELESLQELEASGVEILPAPGVGKAIVPLVASLAISAGGWTTGTSNGYGIFFVLDTSYTGLYFEDPLSGAQIRDTIQPSNVETGAGFIATPLLGYNMDSADRSLWDNLPLSIVSGDTWLGGTTSLTVTVWYDTVSTA